MEGECYVIKSNEYYVREMELSAYCAITVSHTSERCLALRFDNRIIAERVARALNEYTTAAHDARVVAIRVKK